MHVDRLLFTPQSTREDVQFETRYVPIENNARHKSPREASMVHQYTIYKQHCRKSGSVHYIVCYFATIHTSL
jgi:hypothetical protein